MSGPAEAASPAVDPDELRAAYRRHAERRDARDWRGMADCFAEDARYFDPIFGWAEGRAAIRDFLEGAMAGLADRTFHERWHVVEGERLVLYWQCTTGDEPLVTPPRYHGLSALRYAGDGLWLEQMDVYDREQARRSRLAAGAVDQSTT